MKRTLLVAFLGLAASLSCTESSRDSAPGPEGPPAGQASAYSPYPGGRLELRADPQATLATIDGDMVVTVGEFNDRRREFPIWDLGQDVGTARRQLLEQIITHKLIAREARRRRGDDALPPLEQQAPYREERALAQEIIKASVADPSLVSNQEAERYRAEHPDQFQDLEESLPSEQGRLLFIKFSMLSERWKETLESWRAQARVEISEELLAEGSSEG